MPVKKIAARQRNPYPVFTVRFRDGLADRNRLPLDQVIRVLTEVKGMIEAVGQQLQRERGVEDPKGDFGLELVGGFQKGSVRAALAITRDTETGVEAAEQVLDTVTRLGARPQRSRSRGKSRPIALARGDYNPRVVTRLGNISKVQELNKSRLEMGLRGVGTTPHTAMFDRHAAEVVETLRAPNFRIDELTIYGKLQALRDKPGDGDESTRGFFGELVADDGITWRVEFKATDEAKARKFFRHQVAAIGNATYYKAMNPKLVVSEIEADEVRDYEAAFDELYGANPELSKVDLKTLIRQLESD